MREQGREATKEEEEEEEKGNEDDTRTQRASAGNYVSMSRLTMADE